MANDGLPRIELFKEDQLIDTIRLHRHSAEAITNLFIDLGQHRDEKRTWEGVKAEQELYKAFHDL